MFSSFRKLFGMRADNLGSHRPLAAIQPPPVPQPAGKTPPPRSVRVDAQARPAATTAPKPTGLSIPLDSILCRLPALLSPRIRLREVGAAQVMIPLQKILSQIGLGAVKISFGELRQISPPGVFTAENDQDGAAVEIPLHEILSRLDPALLPRRASQKQVAVPSEVTGPFGGQPQMTISKNPPPPAPVLPEFKPMPVPQHLAPAPVLPPQTPLPMPSAAPVPVYASTPAPAPTLMPLEAASIPLQKVERIAPAPEPIAAAPIAMTVPEARAESSSEAPSFWSAPAAAPVAVAVEEEPIFKKATADMPTVISPIATAPVETPAAPRPTLSLSPIELDSPVRLDHTVIKMAESAPLPLSEVVPAPAAAAPAPVETRFLTLAITEVYRAWPEFVQREIIANQLAGVSLALPFGMIELAIRQGKVALPWRVIRSWIKPPVIGYNSPHDATILELPLKTITPLFLAELKTAQPQKKVTVDPTIPDLFSGNAKTTSTSTAPQVNAAAPAPAQALAPSNPPLPKVKPADTNYFAKKTAGEVVEEVAPKVKKGPHPGTDFLNRYATPSEIVTKASALPGVHGALIALPDGLLVASDIPPTMNADTIAAFLPQIFGRVTQCTKELRLGDLNNLNFTVGHIPWKIFKVGAIYFAAFGSPHEPLPTAQLAEIAAELDRKAK